jgi:hypothetical protein
LKKKRIILNLGEVIQEIKTHDLWELALYFPQLFFLKKLGNRKGSSSRSFINCPFHKEKTPSFSYVHDGRFWHCFGCHKTGNTLEFFMEYEQVDLFPAVLKLARAFKIPIKFKNDDREIAPEHTKKIYEYYEGWGAPDQKEENTLPF